MGGNTSGVMMMVVMMSIKESCIVVKVTTCCIRSRRGSSTGGSCRCLRWVGRRHPVGGTRSYHRRMSTKASPDAAPAGKSVSMRSHVGADTGSS